MPFSETQVAIIEDFMTSHDVPGCAIALVADGRITAADGFGQANLETEAAPTADTLWPIASVTKSFTAVAAMQCVEDGLLDLDLPVTDYLPNLVVTDSETTARLTMRRLLTHTSGIGRTGHQDRTREEATNPYPTREALLAALGSVVPQAPVGECFSYSNESYAIAGHVIETVKGKSLERCFAEDIFEPLGMSRTVPRFSNWREDSDRATLYAGANIGPYGSGQSHRGYEVVDLVSDYQTFLSTGGIASTARDLARYQLASMDYHSSALGLSGNALRHMQSQQHGFGDSGWGYGLGYRVMPTERGPVVGHSGGLPGVSTYSLMLPSEQLAAVVLTNRSDIKAMGLAERLLNDVRGPIWRDEVSEPLPIRSKWDTPDPSELDQYVGAYRFRRGPAEVLHGERGIIVHTPSRYDGPVVQLDTVRVARDRFVSVHDAQVVEFRRDAAGFINGFLYSGYRYDRESGG